MEDENYSSAIDAFNGWARQIRQQESSNIYGNDSHLPYLGAYQLSTAALQDAGFQNSNGSWTSLASSYGVTSTATFLASTDAQDAAFQNYAYKNLIYIQSDLSFIGNTIDGVVITYSGLLAGAFLVGHQKLDVFINSNGSVVPVDGNNTPITQYISNYGGYNFILSNSSGNGGFGVPISLSGSGPLNITIDDNGMIANVVSVTSGSTTITNNNGNGQFFDSITLALGSYTSLTPTSDGIAVTIPGSNGQSSQVIVTSTGLSVIGAGGTILYQQYQSTNPQGNPINNGLSDNVAVSGNGVITINGGVSSPGVVVELPNDGSGAVRLYYGGNLVSTLQSGVTEGPDQGLTATLPGSSNILGLSAQGYLSVSSANGTPLFTASPGSTFDPTSGTLTAIGPVTLANGTSFTSLSQSLLTVSASGIGMDSGSGQGVRFNLDGTASFTFGGTDIGTVLPAGARINQAADGALTAVVLSPGFSDVTTLASGGSLRGYCTVGSSSLTWQYTGSQYDIDYDGLNFNYTPLPASQRSAAVDTDLQALVSGMNSADLNPGVRVASLDWLIPGVLARDGDTGALVAVTAASSIGIASQFLFVSPAGSGPGNASVMNLLSSSANGLSFANASTGQSFFLNSNGSGGTIVSDKGNDLYTIQSLYGNAPAYTIGGIASTPTFDSFGNVNILVGDTFFTYNPSNYLFSTSMQLGFGSCGGGTPVTITGTGSVDIEAPGQTASVASFPADTVVTVVPNADQSVTFTSSLGYDTTSATIGLPGGAATSTESVTLAGATTTQTIDSSPYGEVADFLTSGADAFVGSKVPGVAAEIYALLGGNNQIVSIAAQALGSAVIQMSAGNPNDPGFIDDFSSAFASAAASDGLNGALTSAGMPQQAASVISSFTAQVAAQQAVNLMATSGSTLLTSAQITSIAQNIGVNAAASYIGSEIVNATGGNPQDADIAGVIASTALAIDAVIAGAGAICAANPVLGAAIIIGAELLGGLFGPGESVGPNATADVQFENGQYVQDGAGEDKGGDISLAIWMARDAAQLDDSYIQLIGGSVTQAQFMGYGYFKGQFFDSSGGTEYENAPFTHSDEGSAIQQGVIRTLQNTRFSGGDPFMAQVLATTADTTLTELNSDLQVAQDYENYLSNPTLFMAGLIGNASAAAQWQSELARVQSMGLTSPGSTASSDIQSDIATAYQAVLNRGPTAAEMQGWEDAAGAGVSLADLQYVLAKSTGYQIGAVSGDGMAMNNGSLVLAAGINGWVSGDGNAVTVNGGSLWVGGNRDAVAVNGSGESLTLDGAQETVAMSSGYLTLQTQAQASLAGDDNWVGGTNGLVVTIDGNNNWVSGGSGSSLTETGSGNSGTMNAGRLSLSAGSDASLSGDGNTVSVGAGATLWVGGSQDNVTAAGSGAIVTVAGRQETVAMSNGSLTVDDLAQATLTGNGNWVGGGTGVNLAVTGNNGSYRVASGNITLSGDNNWVNGGTGSSLNETGSGNGGTMTDGSLVLSAGSDGSLSGDGNAVSVGAGATLWVGGSQDSITAVGNGGNVTVDGRQETVAMSNGSLTMDDLAQATLTGDGDWVGGGAGVSLAATGNNGSYRIASGDITLSGDNNWVNGGTGSNLNETGSGNGGTMTDGRLVLAAGSDGSLSGDGNTVSIGAGTTLWVGGSQDSITAVGSGGNVTVDGQQETVAMSDGSLMLDDQSQAILTGDDNSVVALDDASISIFGDNNGVSVRGPGVNVSVAGDGDGATMNNGSFNQTTAGWGWLSGDDNTANMGAAANLWVGGSGNAITASGGGQTVIEDGRQNTVAMSNGILSVDDQGQATLIGDNDQVKAGSNASVQVDGSGASVTVTGVGTEVDVTGGKSMLFGLGGGDTLVATGGDETFVSAPNDVLRGGGGDTFLYQPENGQVTIADTGTNNVVRLGGGLTLSDVTLSVAGNGEDLLVGDGNEGDQIDIEGEFGSGGPAIDELAFSDGSAIDLANNRVIVGTGAAVALDGSKSVSIDGTNDDVTMTAQGGVVTVTGSSDSIQMNRGAVNLLDGAGTASGGDGGVFQFKGIAFPSWSDGAYTTAASSQSMQELAATGANAIELVTTQYLDTASSVDIEPNEDTESDANLELAISQAEQQGLQVMLKPHVNVVDGTWEGELDPSDPNTFFDSYKNFIVHYAQIAQETGVPVLCVGAELVSLSGPAYASQWDDIIAAVRQVYTGALTYAATYTEAKNVSFWGKLDYIGIDSYVSLTTEQDPTVEDLEKGWTTVSSDPYIAASEDYMSPVDFYKYLSDSYGKPLIFPEIGYRSVVGSAINPGDWTTQSPVDLQQQADAYQAFLDVWNNDKGDWMKGAFVWDWSTDPSSYIDSYSPQGKPALATLSSWYQWAPGADVLAGDSNTITLGNDDCLAVTGSSNIITVAGTGDVVGLSGNANLIAMNGGSIALSDGSQATMMGSNDTVVAGANTSLSLKGTSNTIIASGVGNFVELDGVNNIAEFSNGSINAENGSASTLVGDNNVALLSGNAALAVTGNSNAISATGNGDILALSGVGNAANLSGGTVISENGSVSTVNGAQNILQFGSGIAIDQLWFARQGNDLDVSVIGTAENTTIQNWYGSPDTGWQFETQDGHALADTQVANLVNAMAGFAPPPAGQTTLSAAQASQLEVVIAGNWHQS